MQICDSQQFNIEIPIYIQIRFPSQCFQALKIYIYKYAHTYIYVCVYIFDTENPVSL